MTSDRLRELAELTRMRPAASQADWSAVRSVLGFDVPADYKELIDGFGAGLFNGYVQIFGPDERQKSFNLSESGLYWNGLYSVDWERRPEARPARLRDRAVTIINWGGTEDALQFFWIADTPDADRWEIAFHTVEGGRWEFFEQSTVEVLLAFVRGELRSALLESYGPDEAITYTPY